VLSYNDGVVLRYDGGGGRSRCRCMCDDNQDARSAFEMLGRVGPSKFLVRHDLGALVS
jgi:hypothetical protein